MGPPQLYVSRNVCSGHVPKLDVRGLSWSHLDCTLPYFGFVLCALHFHFVFSKTLTLHFRVNPTCTGCTNWIEDDGFVFELLGH